MEYLPDSNIDRPDPVADVPTPASAKRGKKWLWGLLAVGVVIAAGLGSLAYFAGDQLYPALKTAAQTFSTINHTPVSNKISFIGNDGDVWLVAPDGKNPEQITDNKRGYRFPTWSPDGRYLAFVGPNQKSDTALYVTPTKNPAPKIIFDNPDSAPFYLYWSPDNQSITFLTQEQSGMAMRLADVLAGNSRIMAEGAPFYWVWSPKGDKLLMHVGGSRAMSEQAHLSIIENQWESSRVELNLAPGGFQAPDWSADGNHFYYVAEDETGQQAMYRTHAETLEQTRLTDLSGYTYMVLSPDEKNIAYLQIEPGDRPPFGTAYLASTDGSSPRRLTEQLVGSMYWSPDGSKLALLTIGQRGQGATAKAGGLAAPLPQDIVFRWLIYDMENDTLEILTSFSPTTHFLQTVPYFDQYHRSLTFWSPDSRYFVITKAEQSESSRQGTAWVLDTTGQAEPVQVGRGTLAVWSWQ